MRRGDGPEVDVCTKSNKESGWRIQNSLKRLSNERVRLLTKIPVAASGRLEKPA